MKFLGCLESCVRPWPKSSYIGQCRIITTNKLLLQVYNKILVFWEPTYGVLLSHTRPYVHPRHLHLFLPLRPLPCGYLLVHTTVTFRSYTRTLDLIFFSLWVTDKSSSSLSPSYTHIDIFVSYYSIYDIGSLVFLGSFNVRSCKSWTTQKSLSMTSFFIITYTQSLYSTVPSLPVIVFSYRLCLSTFILPKHLFFVHYYISYRRVLSENVELPSEVSDNVTRFLIK